jgi:hypothetical protein
MSDVPSWARKGAKVVAIDTYSGLSHPVWSYLNGFHKGRVYTIREVGVGLHMRSPDAVHVRLVEVVNPVEAYGSGTYEVAFRLEYFRPLVDDSDEALARDVALFTEHLRQPSTAREGADA